jgi:hypothetical protein
MTLAEIRAWYYKNRNDHWYNSQLPLDERLMGMLWGKARMVVKRFLIGEQSISPQIAQGYEEVIRQVENREIIWKKANNAHKSADKNSLMYLKAPAVPIKRNKIHSDKNFTIFDRCASCKGNQWLPVEVDGKRLYVCYSCLPPSQYRSFGGVAINESLITRYMEEHLCLNQKFSEKDITSGILTSASTATSARTGMINPK